MSVPLGNMRTLQISAVWAIVACIRPGPTSTATLGTGLVLSNVAEHSTEASRGQDKEHMANVASTANMHNSEHIK